METISNKKSKLYLVGVVILLFFIIGGGLWYWFKTQIYQKTQIENKKIDYIIPGVPYIGIYNHKDLFSHIIGDTASAVASILEYWNPGKNNLVEISRAFRPRSGVLIGDNSIINFINKTYSDYNVERVNISIDEIKNYINPSSRTPLFLFLAIDRNQPLNVTYHPATVLIGIKESEKKLIFHNYWLGNNYEISYDEFNELWGRMRPDERNTYLVIRPKNLTEKLKELTSRETISYPQRSSIMEKAVNIFKNYAIGVGGNHLGLNNLAIDYFSRVIKDSNFEAYFPPYYKVMVLYQLGELFLKQKDYSNALNYTNKAIELNQNLDKPFKDWPGYEVRSNKPDIIDRISGPYRVLGDIEKELKDFKKAKEAYEKALEIQPTNSAARRGLSSVNLELAKIK